MMVSCDTGDFDVPAGRDPMKSSSLKRCLTQLGQPERTTRWVLAALIFCWCAAFGVLPATQTM